MNNDEIRNKTVESLQGILAKSEIEKAKNLLTDENIALMLRFKDELDGLSYDVLLGSLAGMMLELGEFQGSLRIKQLKEIAAANGL